MTKAKEKAEQSEKAKKMCILDNKHKLTDELTKTSDQIRLSGQAFDYMKEFHDMKKEMQQSFGQWQNELNW